MKQSKPPPAAAIQSVAPAALSEAFGNCGATSTRTRYAGRHKTTPSRRMKGSDASAESNGVATALTYDNVLYPTLNPRSYQETSTGVIVLSLYARTSARP